MPSAWLTQPERNGAWCSHDQGIPAEQSGVQVLFSVGGSDDHTALVSLKAVQVAQQHPQQPPCSFMHVRPPADPSGFLAAPANRVHASMAAAAGTKVASPDDGTSDATLEQQNVAGNAVHGSIRAINTVSEKPMCLTAPQHTQAGYAEERVTAV